MKKSNIFKLLSSAVLAVGAASCSSDYLDVMPTTSVGRPDIVASTDNAQLAINGICRAMQTQYYNTSYNNYNGESYLNTTLNDASGPDVVNGLAIYMWGKACLNLETTSNQGYVAPNLMWAYCYNLISQANVILNGIDNAEGPEAQRNFIKAEALTFRAFGYTKLLQFYAPRWEDSNNGQEYCVVLRLEPGVDPRPLSTMGETLDQIYKDLDEAITLYKSSNADRTHKWQPNLNVAQGVYARAALIKNDWAKAQQMAHDARNGYMIMDNNTYLSGFVDDNDDFIWTQSTEPTDIYYWSFGAHNGANGIYTQNWGVGANAISMDLVRELDPTDIRLQCFITPDKIALMNQKGLNKGKVTADYFWDPELVDINNYNNIAVGFFNALNKTPNSRRYGLYNLALNYTVYYCDNIYQGDKAYLDNNGFFPYYTITDGEGATIGDKKADNGKPLKGAMVVTPFGAQLKFMGLPPYGASAYPFLRASEMCLAEAEAAYQAGDIITARKCLDEINKLRIPGFAAANYSGADLLYQIRLSRRIELWGEGHSWTDWKRWNLPIVKHKWIENDVNSGNFTEDMDVVIDPAPSSDNSFWRYNVPTGESDYNNLVDRSLLPF